MKTRRTRKIDVLITAITALTLGLGGSINSQLENLSTRMIVVECKLAIGFCAPGATPEPTSKYSLLDYGKIARVVLGLSVPYVLLKGDRK